MKPSMDETTGAIAHYHRQFDALMTTQQHESDLQKNLRKQAFNRFLQCGLPERKQEAWRTTEVRAFAHNEAFSLAEPTTVLASELPSTGDEVKQRLVFSNGFFNEELSQPLKQPISDGGVTAISQLAPSERETLLSSSLTQNAIIVSHPFNALNEAFFRDGAVIRVPKDQQWESPIQLIFWSGGEKHTNYPRNTIFLEDNSQATVIVEFHGENAYLTCPYTQIILGRGAVLNYVQLQFDSPDAGHLGTLQIHQAAASRSQVHFLNFNGKLSRTDVAVNLNGEQAHGALWGLGVGHGQRLADYHLSVAHNVPHTTSHQNFKFVLQDRSQGYFDGLIRVAKGAQKTDAFQQSRNLLLSTQAHGQSNPRLEIYADDVKCSHGSTTGFLDQDALFYLQARGIPKATAQQMLVKAFAHETFEMLQPPSLIARLSDELGRYLKE